MTRGLYRWRRYLDGLEEAMRLAGRALAEAERDLSASQERSLWRRGALRDAEIEWLRRARDVPFFRELLEAAWRHGPDALREPPDREHLARWRPGETQRDLGSADRFAAEVPVGCSGAPPSGEPPPRLRRAERALTHRTRSFVVVLERLVDPRNASAVLRTVEALGGQELHLVHEEGRVLMARSIDQLARRYVDLHWWRDSTEAIEALARRGYRVYAADFGPGAVPVDELPLGSRNALIFGSEQRGVDAATREAADGLFYLPTVGFTAYLNVSVSVAMTLAVVDRRLAAEGLRERLDPSDEDRLRRAWYTALAGDPQRAREYLAWAEQPPEPASLERDVPSREKARESEHLRRGEEGP
jgi:tRNA (guanosine-2'-O-)-methyltransferase